MERAVVEALDRALERGGVVEKVGQPAVVGVDIGFRESAAGDAALVGGDHEAEARIAQAPERGGDAFRKRDRRGIPRALVVWDEGAVTVEEDRGVHDFERSPLAAAPSGVSPRSESEGSLVCGGVR